MSMDEEDRIPRLSSDLVQWLDDNIIAPNFPSSAVDFRALDEAAVRHIAFQAGARSLVEHLIAWVKEESQEDGEEEVEGSDPYAQFGDVLRGPEFLSTAKVYLTEDDPTES